MFGKVFVFVCVATLSVAEKAQSQGRCNIPPEAPKKIEQVINVCQDEIKLQILQEAIHALKGVNENTRSKRETFSREDRRIAGCILHCVYKKLNALNESGFPTTEGLVDLYSSGVEDKGYRLATLQAVHKCLGQSQKKHLVNAEAIEAPGVSCDIAFDVFDCVADQVGDYCGQTP